MVYSDKYQFLFLHNYKVAGKSIQNCLEKSLDSMDLRKTRLFNHDKQHMSASDAQRICPEAFDNYLVFGFMRNPWDRQVSLYHYILRESRHYLHEKVMTLRSFDNFIRLQLDGYFNLTDQQIDFFCSDGEVRAHFIGRFEALGQDFERVTRDVLRIPGGHLGWDNKSDHGDYRSYYMDETAEKLQTVFKKDIEFFSYSFDGGHSESPYMSKSRLERLHDQ